MAKIYAKLARLFSALARHCDDRSGPYAAQYRYTGNAYVKPMGKGIEIPWGNGGNSFLEDEIPEGHWHINVEAWKRNGR